MLVYNNREEYGEGGPVDCASFEDCADMMGPSFEEWVNDAIRDPNFVVDAGAYDRLVASMRAGFLEGLNVVCPICGTHGPVGEESWTCPKHKEEIK